METPKNRNWKVLKSEYLSSQPWFTVRREEVELPNGNRIPEYFIFEYPDQCDRNHQRAEIRICKPIPSWTGYHGSRTLRRCLRKGRRFPTRLRPTGIARRDRLRQRKLERTDGNRRQSEHPHQPDLLLSCHRCRVSHGTTSGRHGRPQRPPSDSRRSKRIVAKRPDQTSAPCRPTLEIHGDESFDLRYFLNSGEQKQTNHKNKASCLCHNNSIGMARPFHQYGTTVSSAWHNRFIDMAQTLPAYDTTRTCCSA